MHSLISGIEKYHDNQLQTSQLRLANNMSDILHLLKIKNYLTAYSRESQAGIGTAQIITFTHEIVTNARLRSITSREYS